MSNTTAGNYYDKDYFDAGRKHLKSNYSYYRPNLWTNFMYWFGARHIVLELLGSKSFFNHKKVKKEVIDIGGAKGYIASQLQEFLPKSKVWNMDFSSYAIENAFPNIRKRSVVGDIRKIPFKSNCFDVIVCFDVLEHLIASDMPKALEEIKRVMKPGGVGLIVPYVGENPLDCDKSHISIFPVSWWRRKISESGLVIRDSFGSRIVRFLARLYLWNIFPTFRKSFLVVEKQP